MKTLYYITFRSVTHAQRGEKVLAAQGYRCLLRRTPRWMEERGCGYCLQMTLEDIAPVLTLLREGGIPQGKVYIRKENGAFQEVYP